MSPVGGSREGCVLSQPSLGTGRGSRWEQGRGSSGLRESVGLDGVEEETGDTTMAEKRGNEEKKRPTYMEQSIPKLHPGQSGIHPQSEGQ